MIKLINDQAPDIKDKWATAVLPKKLNNTSSLGGSDLSVFQYTEHKDEALKFLAYMSKPETQLEWLKLTNTLPATKKAWEDPALTSDANYKVIGEQMNASEPMPLINSWEEIAQNVLKTFENIYRGGANVQTELDAFNKSLNPSFPNNHVSTLQLASLCWLAVQYYKHSIPRKGEDLL